jgi:hypothetical protein
MAILAAIPIITAIGTGSGYAIAAGIAVAAAASYIDSAFVMPALMKKNAKDQDPEALFGLPQASVGLGQPRVWAIGNKVRVPMHVMYQSQKTRTSAAGGGRKNGTTNTIEKVYADLAIALNNRKIDGLQQIVGNGKFLFIQDRNLINTTSSTITVSQDGLNIKLQMQSIFDQEFSDRFIVYDYVRLDNFRITSGTDINQGHWKVVAVTGHAGNNFSSLTLAPWTAQDTSGTINALCGDVSAPSIITRIDDIFFEDTGHQTNSLLRILSGYDSLSGQTYSYFVILVAREPWRPENITGTDIANILAGTNRDRNNVLATDITAAVFNGNTNTTTNYTGNLAIINIGFVRATAAGWYSPFYYDPTYFLSKSCFATVSGRIRYGNLRNSNPSIYDPTLMASAPIIHYGDELQTEDANIAIKETPGSIPGFRGVSYVSMNELDLSTFGNQVPHTLESLIEPDKGMTWPQAITAICERSGLTASQIDVSKIQASPFLGLYLQGPMPGSTALQPLLMAGQILTQEHDGVIHFFNIEQAEIVQLENGADFSDLGAMAGSDTPMRADKVAYTQVDYGDLPTSVAVRHQDPDSIYQQGYQKFSLRSTNAFKKSVETELDLRMMVLSRRSAKELAANLLRRSWINSQKVELMLPVAYLDLLENDIITVTDDSGELVNARIVRREMGANMLVSITAVREEQSLSSSGSSVQRLGGIIPNFQGIPNIASDFVDVPPLLDAHASQPGIYICATAKGEIFQGAQVWESRDSGVNYELVGNLLNEWQVGTTQTVLNSAVTYGETANGGPFTDSINNTVEVLFDSLGPSWLPLNNWTDADIVRGRGWFLIGDEIVGVKSVELLNNGNYLLKDLVRGLRGTFHSCDAAKATGLRVVRLDQFMSGNLWRQFDDGVAQSLPTTRMYKVVPSSATLGDVAAQTVTVNCWNSRPLPAYLSKVISASPYSVRFGVNHRSRMNFAVGASYKVPLDESFEAYTLRIYNPANTTLMRTKNITSIGSGSNEIRDKWMDYTPAEQTTDGYTPGASTMFWVEIEQDGQFGQGQTWRQQI